MNQNHTKRNTVAAIIVIGIIAVMVMLAYGFIRKRG